MPNFPRKRVAPIESSSDIIEIRPSRYLRIQHHNARPRDEQFNKEMEIFMQYKKTGIPSSGPLTMSKRLPNNVPNQSLISPSSQDQENMSSTHENVSKQSSNTCVSTNELVKDNSTSQSPPDDDIISSYVNPSASSSILSTPCHGNVSDKVQSASSVLVALHMSQQQNQNDFHKGVTNAPAAKLKSGTPLFKHIDKVNSTSQPDSQKNVPLDSKVNISSSEKNSLCDSKNISDGKEYNQNKTAKVTLTNSHANAISDVVLFFIHGVGGSSDIWCAQIHHFAQRGYEIIAPDLIGHGFSSCPKAARAYHFKEIAADVGELFDKYCKKRNVVVGHSYGASFATMLARTRSRRIHKLVLISSGPPTPLAPQPGVFTLPICVLGCIKPCLVCGFKKGAFHKKRKPVIAKKNAFCVPTNVLQHMMNGQDWADGDELYHNWLTCPCLLIYGAQDELVSLEDELDTQRAIFNSRLEIVKDASHMVMMEAPNEVNELLQNFIEQAAITQNQEHQPSSSAEPTVTSSFKRQKSLISLKSHVTQKSHS